MDLQEWELLSDDGFVDVHQDEGNRVIMSTGNFNPSNSVIDMNYFQKITQFDQQKTVNIIPGEEEVTKLPIEDFSSKEATSQEKEGDQEVKTQVFFKKLKEENECVDLKIDSPKSSNRGFSPQIDMGSFQFEEKLVVDDCKFEEKLVDDDCKVEEKLVVDDGKFEKEKQEVVVEKGINFDEKEEVGWDDDEDNNGGLSIWKWAMSGVGALFTFGFAAATVSLIVLGNRHKEHHKNPQEIHFQFYTHDKRMKQVMHHATKLNEAITAVHGAPITRAHITIGGYYEGLL